MVTWSDDNADMHYGKVLRRYIKAKGLVLVVQPTRPDQSDPIEVPATEVLDNYEDTDDLENYLARHLGTASGNEPEGEDEDEELLDEGDNPVQPPLGPVSPVADTEYVVGDWVEFELDQEIRKGEIVENGTKLRVQIGLVVTPVARKRVIRKCTNPNQSEARAEEQATSKGIAEATAAADSDADADADVDSDADAEADAEAEAWVAAASAAVVRDPKNFAWIERLVELMQADSTPVKHVSVAHKKLVKEAFARYKSEQDFDDEAIWTVLSKLACSAIRFNRMVAATKPESELDFFPDEEQRDAGALAKPFPARGANTKGKKKLASEPPSEPSSSDDENDEDVSDVSDDPKKTPNMVDTLLSATLDKCKKCPNYHETRDACRIVNPPLSDTEDEIGAGTPYQKLVAFVNKKQPGQDKKVQKKVAAMLYVMLATNSADYSTLPQALKYVKDGDPSQVKAFLCIKVLNKAAHAPEVQKLVFGMHTMLVHLAA